MAIFKKALCALTALGVSSMFAAGNEQIMTVSQKMQSTNSNASKATSQISTMDYLPSISSPDNWRISGAFLYFLPSVDDTSFVIKNDVADWEDPNGRREHNNFGFEPGFRVGAEYAMTQNERSLGVFYSQVLATSNKHVSSADPYYLYATLGAPNEVTDNDLDEYYGDASSHQNLAYRRLDFNFSQLMVKAHGFNLFVQPGLEYARLTLGQKITYSIPDEYKVETKLNSRTWGIGPQLGMALDYNFCQGSWNSGTNYAFSFTSLFSGSLLAANYKTSYESYDAYDLEDTDNQFVHEDSSWRVIPALHARAGLNYLVRGENVGFNLGIGYEFNSYIRGSSRVVFYTEDLEGLSNTFFNNFDLQGMYIQASLSF